MRQRALLSLECAVLFIVLPMAMMYLGQRRMAVLGLWVFALAVSLYFRKQEGFSWRAEWNAAAVNRRSVAQLLRLFIPAALALTLLATQLERAVLFGFSRERPGMWLLVMLLYPLLSVIPQELIYRSFFCRRYRPLLPSRHGVAALSALAFGFAHIVLENPVAVLLCTAGGWIFARTYARHRSLALVSLEHALYGCTVFTVGLGWYFYSGAQG